MSKAKQSNVRVVMIGTAMGMQGGVSTVVDVLKNAGLFERCNVMYIPTHRDGGVVRKLQVFFLGWCRYIAMLIGGRIGLLHAHTASRASFWRKSMFMLPAFFARVPVILHIHGAEFQVFYEKECSALSRSVVQYIFARADQVVMLSESWLQWVRTTFPTAKAKVIPNPIVVPEANTTEVRHPFSLLFLGRLGQRKGVFDLLHAAAELAPRYPDLRILLGGDGELDAVRDQAKGLGISAHVSLLGWVKGADKARLLKEATIYVLPSYNEGLPMSVLEAMAYGLPVVSTPVGGTPEAVRDGEEGFLVQPGDVRQLAARLDRLLADPDLRVRMGDAALVRAVSRFGATGVVEQWVALYGELGNACRHS